MSVTFGDYRVALTGGFSMDDDDSYLYGDSAEDVKPAAVQTTGESRTRETLPSFLYFSLSEMEILMIFASLV